MHWAQRAELTAETRLAAKVMAKSVKLPSFGKLSRVSVTAFQHRGPLADTAAYIGPLKSCLDGLVDAGVLQDDGPEFVGEIAFQPTQRARFPREVGLLLVLTPASK